MNLKIKRVAITAAKKAGRTLLRQYENFDRGTVELKAHHEILTKADLLSEKIILKEIKKIFPQHKILSEEQGYIGSVQRPRYYKMPPTAGDGAPAPLHIGVGQAEECCGASRQGGMRPMDSDYLWIIDPLDGTTNFSMHNPLWSVSIAVVETQDFAFLRGEIILGVIYAPLLGELYLAEKGKGARRNGKKIKVSGHTKKALHTFCHGRANKYVKKALKYYRYQKLNELDCRQMGSAAIELAYVAGGRTESIMIPGANSWDVAAGVLLVREAGGKVTDFKGKEWSLDSSDMLATNGKVHEGLLKVINRR